MRCRASLETADAPSAEGRRHSRQPQGA
jgi:hypothetical protein